MAYGVSTRALTTIADGSVEFIRGVSINHGMGVIRVLGPNPCAFCILLASQQVVYREGAWEETDGKYVGPGVAKVHDGCQCSLMPFPLDGRAEFPPGVREAKELWDSLRPYMVGLSSKEKVNLFRRVVRDGSVDGRRLMKEPRPKHMDRLDELRLVIPGLMVELAVARDFQQEHPEFDSNVHAEFAQQQLEYRLQQWKRYGGEETDFADAYVWMINRIAANYPPETVKEEKRELAKWAKRTSKKQERLAGNDKLKEKNPREFEYRRKDLAGDQLDIAYSSYKIEWLVERAPDAWKEWDKYWGDYDPSQVDTRSALDPTITLEDDD